MGFKMFDLYAVREGKDDKTFFPPIGVCFAGEKDDGTPKLSIQLNMFPKETFYGSLRQKREESKAGKDPDW